MSPEGRHEGTKIVHRVDIIVSEDDGLLDRLQSERKEDVIYLFTNQAKIVNEGQNGPVVAHSTVVELVLRNGSVVDESNTKNGGGTNTAEESVLMEGSHIESAPGDAVVSVAEVLGLLDTHIEEVVTVEGVYVPIDDLLVVARGDLTGDVEVDLDVVLLAVDGADRVVDVGEGKHHVISLLKDGRSGEDNGELDAVGLEGVDGAGGVDNDAGLLDSFLGIVGVNTHPSEGLAVNTNETTHGSDAAGPGETSGRCKQAKEMNQHTSERARCHRGCRSGTRCYGEMIKT